MPETFKSRKEWAIAKGYPVKPGKGRMPRDVSAACDAAIKSGELIIEVATPTPRKPARAVDSETGEPKPAKPAGNGIVEPANPLHPEYTKVYGMVDGKKVYGTMRAACFCCGVSLYWCGCSAPKAIVSNSSGYVPVVMEV